MDDTDTYFAALKTIIKGNKDLNSLIAATMLTNDMSFRDALIHVYNLFHDVKLESTD